MDPTSRSAYRRSRCTESERSSSGARAPPASLAVVVDLSDRSHFMEERMVGKEQREKQNRYSPENGTTSGSPGNDASRKAMDHEPVAAGRGTDRRGFLRHVAGTSGAMALGLAWPASVGLSGELSRQADPSPDEPQRTKQAEKIRVDAAKLAEKRTQPDHPNNGEEKLYANRIASYSKGLPHNHLGEVDPNAYKALLQAMASGLNADFESIPLGLGRRLT